ncbi:helix-turn-helix domain-containing protein [Pontibacter sp. SGAir0037]|uniref:helix-turn-helix domain-containing protein n=1 Tax=Pontibacter sp. SGAir0037 TaxID=2571030 RepID=UPI0010CCE7A0|nr:helix-turn-helix transcriptional regulator [Pontibacter sp. SGAir0037]QCR22527.1 transcriptional regulator [Pontibacter sp. SGAir0037]
METTMKPVHIGKKISRIRELRGIKQESLAHELGVSQQTVSRIEASEAVEEETLAKIAKVLDVNPEAIKNYSDDAVVNFFNTFNDTTISGPSFNNHCSIAFNPIEKLMDVMEENKKLYERLLQSEKEKLQFEREKVELMERLLKKE